MKTVVYRNCINAEEGWFDWRVKCHMEDGEWILVSTGNTCKQLAIVQARYMAYLFPSGRFYGHDPLERMATI